MYVHTIVSPTLNVLPPILSDLLLLSDFDESDFEDELLLFLLLLLLFLLLLLLLFLLLFVLPESVFEELLLVVLLVSLFSITELCWLFEFLPEELPPEFSELLPESPDLLLPPALLFTGTAFVSSTYSVLP
ncbi:hypothetical protein DWX71_02540 [Ruminococcus bromii]|nr:hypothetical protein DWX71_02540 [Ruminococcus bromii]